MAAEDWDAPWVISFYGYCRSLYGEAPTRNVPRRSQCDCDRGTGRLQPTYSVVLWMVHLLCLEQVLNGFSQSIQRSRLTRKGLLGIVDGFVKVFDSAAVVFSDFGDLMLQFDDSQL